MIATLAAPAMGDPATNAGVSNIEPEIVDGTWKLTVSTTDDGIEWTNDPARTVAGQRGSLTVPYVQVGETLTFEIDALDENGESDIQYAGAVEVAISTDATFENTDPRVSLGFLDASVGDSNIQQLSFKKDWIVTTFATGEYYLLVRAQDSAGALSDVYNAGTIFIAPVSIIGVYKDVESSPVALTGIDFGTNAPGTTAPANENTIGVKNLCTGNAIIDVFVKTDDLTRASAGGTGRIPADEMDLTAVALGNGDLKMSTFDQLGSDDLENNDQWEFNLALNYPATIPVGTYAGAFYITSVIE